MGVRVQIHIEKTLQHARFGLGNSYLMCFMLYTPIFLTYMSSVPFRSQVKAETVLKVPKVMFSEIVNGESDVYDKHRIW